MAIRVLLVEDEPAMRTVLRISLQRRTGVVIVGEAGTGADAAQLAGEVRPDVVVLDLGLPDMRPRDLLAQVRRASPASAIVIFSGADIDRSWFERRSEAYLTKGSELDRLLDLVEQIGAQGPGQHTVLDLPETLLAAGEARVAVRNLLERWGFHDLVDDATLVVSELVGNAVEHASSSCVVVIDRADGGLRIEVQDQSEADPEPRSARLQDERGRGLMIVSALAKAWGVEHGARSKSVWVELSGDRP